MSINYNDNTQLQEVYDAFFIKIPSHNFSTEKSKVFQYFKTSVGKTSNTVNEDLTYTATTTGDSPSYDEICLLVHYHKIVLN